MRKSKLILVTVLVVLVLAPAAAFANLAKFGPIVPYDAATHTGNGYTRYYMDSNGVMVDLPVPVFAATDPSIPVILFGDNFVAPMMIFDEPLVAGIGITQAMLDYSATIGFGHECFYFHATADGDTFAPPLDSTDPQGQRRLGRFNIVLGIEAAFATVVPVGAAKDGEQAVFARRRLNWAAAPEGFYRFTHPYGVELIPSEPGGGIIYTIDTGVINIFPFNFSLALAGSIGPFLVQVDPPPQVTPAPGAPPLPPGFNKPTDWLGDGATPATFTGSPTGFNGFRLEAFQDEAMTIPLNLWPSFPVGATTNTIETNLGVISGHRYRFPNLAGLEMMLLLDD
jgi:hypothetical protein